MGLLYYGSRLDYDGVLDFGYGLTRRLPGNALVWSEFARRAWFSGKARLVELPVKQLTPNLRRFPRSYLFRTADSYMQRIAGRPAEGRKVAEIAVRCSTRNPDAWLFLNGSIGDQADAVRHARYIRDLTHDQLAYCSELYDESMPIVIQAIRLDPQYASAWSTVSEGAAFKGNNRLADAAFWKALALDPGCEPTYEWGLQLYQPKWLNDEDSLAQVVRTAAAAGKHWPYVSRFEIAWEAIIIGDQIHRPGLGHLAKPLLQTDAERAELQRAVEKYNRQSRTGH